jgi:hypothetical protein
VKVHLCRSTGCAAPEAHLPDCADPQQCHGCAPRVAADGLNLCWPHRDQLARNAIRAADVHAELLLQLTPMAGPGEMTSGTREHGLKLNPRAVEARAKIEQVLALWCKLVVDERGVQAPPGDVYALAEFVARNATWLAAHPLAGHCSDEVRELSHGEPWRVAYPNGTRVRPVGMCPRQDCYGTVNAILRPSPALPSEVTCTENREHTWPAHRWLELMGEMKR